MNVKLPDGAPLQPDKVNATDQSDIQVTHPIGISSPPDHRGRIDLVNCRVEGFPNNGAYLTGDPGSWTVYRGIYKNNGNGNVRLETDYVVIDLLPTNPE